VSRPGLKAAAVLVVLAVLGWHVHARSKPEAELNVADRVLLSATGPIQRGLHGLIGGTGDLGSHYLFLVGVSRENDELRAELIQARAAIAELSELRRENDRLRELVALRDRAPATTVAASVVGRGTSARFRTFRIDRGSDDGVEAGMAVLSAAGAVGRVLRASGDYADVLLLTDGLSAAGAVVQESRLRGVVLGDGDDTLTLGFVRRADASGVVPGDVLVTSGEDGVFPEGVALGVVTEAAAPETGLFLDIVVEPAVALDRLDEVLVVLEHGAGPFTLPMVDPDPSADPTDENDAEASVGQVVAP
jgi:rod shape-determining protein MreC